LGMPMHPKEEEEDMVQPKLGDVGEPLKDDSNTQTQNSFVIYENPCYDQHTMVTYENPCYYDEIYNAPLLDSNDNEECCLDMLYDNALDDGPMPNDNPPCIIHEDRNDTLVIHDDTLISKSPIIFLNSPGLTLEEKYELARKYICGLQSAVCNHDLDIENITSNYFERGKHANECHYSYNDPLCMKNSMNLHAWNGYNVRLAARECNYYERGGDKCPLYASNYYMLCSPTDNMQRYDSTCSYLVIYKIPMHRKKVRLRCYCFNILCCFLPCLNLNIILIGMSTPWDPGIMHGALPKEKGGSTKI